MCQLTLASLAQRTGRHLMGGGAEAVMWFLGRPAALGRAMTRDLLLLFIVTTTGLFI